MSAIRDKARDILDKFLPPGKVFTSNGADGNYTRLTGISHKTLEASWAKGGKLTGCNGFTGWYGGQLGSKTYLGGFELAKIAGKAGKPGAYIASTSTKRPLYGDILFHKSFHVDVALDFDGDVLSYAAGGRGGPRAGYDIVKRITGKGPYDHSKIGGWLDIDILLGGMSASLPVPAWLLGWWSISEGASRYYYYFYRSGVMQYTPNSSYLSVCPNLGDAASASFLVDAVGNVTIRWGDEASDELFSPSPKGSQTEMTGKYADGRSLKMSATKVGG